MQFPLLALLLLPLAAAAPNISPRAAVPVSLSWDAVYGTAGASMNSMACSDGKNGLASKWPKLGNVPRFPNVAAAPTVTGWNDVDCGKCYRLYYDGKTEYVTAVDVSRGGFVLSKATLDKLTGGRAAAVGRVTGQFVEVPKKNCGTA